jgi:NAD+ kinase
MKIVVIGKIKKDVDMLKRRIKRCSSCKIVEKNPDFVFSFGGDGSFLIAERIFPLIPKLLIRDRSLCKKCNEDKLKIVLEKLIHKQFIIKKYYKIEAKIKKQNKLIKKIAVNDIVIRNKEPYHALRFTLRINNKRINDVFIGDGIVTATSFGSTGYFYSITKKNFKEGVGVAFNNVTIKANPLIFKNPIIKLKIIRNKAVVCSDNDRRTIIIDKGDIVEIRKSKERFKIIEINKIH